MVTFPCCDTVFWAAAAHPTAIAGGLAETAVECGMTGGGCTVADYAWGAATAGVASVSAKRMGCDLSFSEDTLVTTEEGLVPISEIEEGDYVLAYHEETGEVGYYPVTTTWAHEDPVLTYLVIEGEFIATTPNHPFYTTEGWVEAGELGEDAYVVRAGGTPGQVWESLTFTHPRQMYDLTVAEAHTFFVGEEQWLVHNCNGEFSIIDWTGYPDDLPRPNGPFRLLDGNEYQTARQAANRANSQIRVTQGLGPDLQIHEIQPVKFGGSPTDPANKIYLDTTFHRTQVTPWWNRLQRQLEQ